MTTEQTAFGNVVWHNLHRWLEQLQQPNITYLQQKYHQVLRVIRLALPVEAASTQVQELIFNFSVYMERWGYWEAWQSILQQALSLAHQRHDKAMEVRLLVLLARLAQRQSDFKKVATYYRHVMRLAPQIGDMENKARACSNLSYLYTELGYWWRAEILGQTALTIFTELDYPHGLAHTHNHLGTLYARLRQWELAQTHLEKACAIWQKMGDAHGVMRGKLNLGLLYMNWVKYAQALTCLELALKTAQETGEAALLGTIYNNIGTSYRLLQRLQEAERYFWLSEKIVRQTNDYIGLAHVHANLGLVYLKCGRLSESENYLLLSLEQYHLLGNFYFQIETQFYVIDLYLAQNQLPKATKQLERLSTELALAPHNSAFDHLRSRLKTYVEQLRVLKENG